MDAEKTVQRSETQNVSQIQRDLHKRDELLLTPDEQRIKEAFQDRNWNEIKIATPGLFSK
jgi:hypothetical protein